MRSFHSLGCCALVAGALALPTAVQAQESWFGGLFGGSSPAPAAPPSYDGGYGSEPLRVDVRPMRSPRRQLRVRPHIARIGRPARTSTIAANTEAYARLNPATNARWYLEDPTLRRGDIVVLDRGAMVFVGQKAASHGASDFQPASEAPDISSAERERIEKLAVVNSD